MITRFFRLILSQEGTNIFIGVDEAGRGCLAGPVVSASVAIYEDQVIEGVNDSKLLSPKKEMIFMMSFRMNV